MYIYICNIYIKHRKFVILCLFLFFRARIDKNVLTGVSPMVQISIYYLHIFVIYLHLFLFTYAFIYLKQVLLCSPDCPQPSQCSVIYIYVYIYIRIYTHHTYVCYKIHTYHDTHICHNICIIIDTYVYVCIMGESRRLMTK